MARAVFSNAKLPQSAVDRDAYMVEDVARLSPLKDRHINFLGRYLFHITASGSGQGLRPFRDPDTPEDGDEEE